MRTVLSRKTVLLPLGKQGENLAQQIIFFDPIDWAKDYGPGTVQLLHQRPGEDTPYPVVITEEADGSYSWVVTAADTALAGRGQCELRYLAGDTVVKSRTWNTIVGDALGEPSETPPEAQQGWVDKILQAGTDVEDAAKRAENAAVRQPYPNGETGTWWVWDVEAGAYKDSGIASSAYTLLAMTSSVLGGAIADPAQKGDTQPVRIGKDNKLYTAPGGGISGDCIPAPASAEVGQTIVVKTVDSAGKPTEWEAADLPGGEEWKSITFDFSQQYAASVKLELPSPNIKEGLLHFKLRHDGAAVTSTTNFRIYCDREAVGGAAGYMFNGAGLHTDERKGQLKWEAISDMPRYNTVAECPEWARETVQKLVDRKVLNGTDQGLDLSHDMVRLLVLLDRAGALEK